MVRVLRCTVVQPCRIHCTLGSSRQATSDGCAVNCLFSGDDAILRGDWKTKPDK